MKQSSCYSINGVDDAQRFHAVKVTPSFSQYFCSFFPFNSTFWLKNPLLLQEALDIVHVSKEDQESVFAMLVAVLWLGNVSFTIIDNENHVEPEPDESKALQSLNTDTCSFKVILLFCKFVCKNSTSIIFVSFSWRRVYLFQICCFIFVAHLAGAHARLTKCCICFSFLFRFVNCC